MYARLTRLRLDPAAIDDAIDLTHSHLIPLFVEQEGALHGYWMADRDTGRAMTITCWAGLDDLYRATADAGEARTRVAEKLGALPLGTEIHRIHGLAGGAPPISGEHVFSRVIWAEGLSGDVDAVVDDLFAAAHAALRDRPGFRSVCWLADVPSGNGLGITSWESLEHLHADDGANADLRRRVETGLGCRLSAPEVFETIGAANRPADEVLDLVALAERRATR